MTQICLHGHKKQIGEHYLWFCINRKKKNHLIFRYVTGVVSANYQLGSRYNQMEIPSAEIYYFENSYFGQYFHSSFMDVSVHLRQFLLSVYAERVPPVELQLSLRCLRERSRCLFVSDGARGFDR